MLRERLPERSIEDPFQIECGDPNLRFRRDQVASRVRHLALPAVDVGPAGAAHAFAEPRHLEVGAGAVKVHPLHVRERAGLQRRQICRRSVQNHVEASLVALRLASALEAPFRAVPRPGFLGIERQREVDGPVEQPLGLLAQTGGRAGGAGVGLIQLALDLRQQVRAREMHALAAGGHVEVRRGEIEIGRDRALHRLGEREGVRRSGRVHPPERGIGEHTPSGREADQSCGREIQCQLGGAHQPHRQRARVLSCQNALKVYRDPAAPPQPVFRRLVGRQSAQPDVGIRGITQRGKPTSIEACHDACVLGLRHRGQRSEVDRVDPGR